MKNSLISIFACSLAFSSPASAELIGYWSFETDFMDESGEGNHGTAVGNVTLDNVSPAAAGSQSMALANEADDSYLDINSGGGGMMISDIPAFTIAMWVNSSIVQDDERIFSESSSTDIDPLYNIGTSSVGAGGPEVDFYHRLADGTVTNNHPLSTTQPFGDGTWHHIAIVDVEGAVDLYVDGIFDRSFTYADVSLEIDTTTFGGIFRASGATPICCGFTGNLDDIAVWDQELSGAEIASIADGTFSPPDLVLVPVDADGDGMRDVYEQQIIDADAGDDIGTLADVLPGDDFDMDGSTNKDEEDLGTDPTDPDSDDDGANDGSETNTGVWMSETDRGTDPLNEDSDNDTLLDGDENPDLPFIDLDQPGTDPNLIDTDGDGLSDGSEIESGSDPTDANDPGVVPTLSIDFNSTTQGGGPNSIGLPYQDYNAGHEVPADFVRQTYTAFNTTVGITPSWPDTSAVATTMQMIDRAAGNDNQWLGTQVDLLTDWIGVDSRTSQGGLGNFDGIIGTPTPILLTLDGLPGGTYNWTSYHHDTENIHTSFTMEISVDGGATFEDVGQFQMTSSSTGGNPANPMTETGPDPQSLSSTVRHSFGTDGTADVVLRFIPLSQIAVHQQLFGINGFDLAQTSTNFNKFAITSVVRNPDDSYTITWPSTPGQIFSIDTTTDLQSWPGDLDDGYPAAKVGEETSITFTPDANSERLFVRIRIVTD